MTTWAQHLAGEDRAWSLIVKIEGVGRRLTNAERSGGITDGRYRFCTGAPSYVGNSTEPADLWRDVLGVLIDEADAELPDILSEELQEEGGIADRSASVTLTLADHDDFLTALVTVDIEPTISVSTDSATATTIFAPDTAAASLISASTDVLFVDGESMLVTARPGSSGTSSIDVIRGYLATQATDHPTGSAAYLASPFLGGRRMEIYVAPLDGDDATTEQLVGRYTIDGIGWDSGINAWVLSARSEVEAFEASLPETPLITRGRAHPFTDLTLISWDDPLPTDEWGTDHLLIDGEIVRIERNNATLIGRVLARGLAGTERGDLDGDEQTVTHVLVPDPDASDFRFSPGPTPSTDRTSGTWTEVVDPISILLCVLTSSRTSNDGFELTNYLAARGNYSSLPVGYGMGIPAADIDWDSFFDVRDRLPDVRLHNLVLGNKSAQAKAWIDEQILRPLQVHLVITAGQLRLTKIRAPLAGQTLPQVDADTILRADDLPDVSITRDIATQAKRVEFELGPDKVKAISQVANPTRARRVIKIPVPGADAGQLSLWQGFATALARQAFRPRSVASTAVDASLWAVLVGDVVEVTLLEGPDLTSGVRGWTQRVAQVVYREPRMDSDRGVWLQTRLRLYSPGQLARRICPAAWISSVSVNDATCKPNRFTESDATGNLPTQDVAAFTVGDVVQLVDPDGALAVVGTETVNAIDTGTNTVTLSGDFSGTMAADTLIVYAPADNATPTQFTRNAWLADSDFKVGTSDASPTYYEEA